MLTPEAYTRGLVVLVVLVREPLHLVFPLVLLLLSDRVRRCPRLLVVQVLRSKPPQVVPSAYASVR